MARKVMGAEDDAPEITATLFGKMRPMKEVTPDMVEAIKIAGLAKARQTTGQRQR